MMTNEVENLGMFLLSIWTSSYEVPVKCFALLSTALTACFVINLEEFFIYNKAGVLFLIFMW